MIVTRDNVRTRYDLKFVSCSTQWFAIVMRAGDVLVTDESVHANKVVHAAIDRDLNRTHALAMQWRFESWIREIQDNGEE